jgi:hypothetical protein
MEFYLTVLDLFCNTGRDVLSIFAGGKIICAAWVCISMTQLLILYPFHDIQARFGRVDTNLECITAFLFKSVRLEDGN